MSTPSVLRESWYRAKVRLSPKRETGFFDSYPLYFQSETRAEPDRLNQRYRAMIEANRDVIAGRRILDIASHDGRWSFAAIKAGAASVLGIEARPHLVEQSYAKAIQYGATGMEFRCGDALAELDRLNPGHFDTIFCFGFLYHTSEPMLLLRHVARLRPSALIVDTAVCRGNEPMVELRREPVDRDATQAIADGGSNTALVSKPTVPALELMLQAAGFSRTRYYAWRKAGIRRWDDLHDYYMGQRISAVCLR